MVNLKQYYDSYYVKKLSEISSLDYPPDFHLLAPGAVYGEAVSLLQPLTDSKSGAGNPKPLEIGFGTGAMMHWFRHRGLDPYGVDFSAPLVENLDKRGFRVCRHDLNEDPLPFQDESFDIILALDVLEHVISPGAMVAETYRVCAPGGTFLLSTANSRTLASVYKLLVKGRFPWTSEEKHGWDCGHLHYFTSRDVTELCESHGFEVTKVRGISTARRALTGFVKRAVFSLLPYATACEFFSGSFLVLCRKPGSKS